MLLGRSSLWGVTMYIYIYIYIYIYMDMLYVHWYCIIYLTANLLWFTSGIYWYSEHLQYIHRVCPVLMIRPHVCLCIYWTYSMYIKISSQIIRALPVTVWNREKWQSSQDSYKLDSLAAVSWLILDILTKQDKKKTDDQWPWLRNLGGTYHMYHMSGQWSIHFQLFTAGIGRLSMPGIFFPNSMEKIMGKSGEMEHPMTVTVCELENCPFIYIYIYIYIWFIYILYTYYDLPSSKMLMFRRWLQQKSTVIIPYHPVSLTNGERSYCSIDLLFTSHHSVPSGNDCYSLRTGKWQKTKQVVWLLGYNWYIDYPPVICYIAIENGPNRNSGFTELQDGGSFQFANCQRVSHLSYPFSSWETGTCCAKELPCKPSCRRFHRPSGDFIKMWRLKNYGGLPIKHCDFP